MTDEGDTRTLRVAVLGPGGVGGLLAGLLARDGNVVTCLASDTTAATIRANGITVRSGRFGDFTVPVRASSALDEPVDVCLVTVKATHLESALDRVPSYTVRSTLLVPLLNGVEHVETIRHRYPTATVTPATIRVESTRVAAGLIDHTSPFAAIEVATAQDGIGLTASLVDCLRRAGLEARVRDDETAMLWDKFVLFAPIALLTTLAAADVGVVCGTRLEDLVSVVDEIAAVANRLGAKIDTAAVLTSLRAVPASMKSSMLRDAEAGRPIELEAIGGCVLRAAHRVGVPVPVTTSLVEQLRGRGHAQQRE